MNTTTRTRRTLAAAATLGLLAVPVAAYAGNDVATSGSVTAASGNGPLMPVASVPDLSNGKTTEIALDQGFLDALTSLKLTPGVVGEGQLENGSLIFPITGGNVSVFEKGAVRPYVIGQIWHEGSGLSLEAGGTTVELTDFNVDPGASKIYGDVAVNGKTAATNAYLFKADGSTLEPLKTQGSDAILTGTQVKISDVAAPLLNDTFGTDAVTPGLLVGTATITVATQ